MPATAAQISRIRRLSGDNASDVNKRLVSDDDISGLFDTYGTICGTAYQVALERLADASNNIQVSGQNASANPKVQMIEQLLMRIEKTCPEARQVTSTFNISLGIDEETQYDNID